MPSYQVQYRAQGTSSWTDGPLVDTGASRSGSTAVTGLTNGTAYEFRVVRTSSGIASRNVLSATPVAAFESNLTAAEGSATSSGDAAQIGTYGGSRGLLVSLANNGQTFTVSYRVGSGSWTQFGSKAGGNTLTGGTSVGGRSFFFAFPSDVSGITAAQVIVAKSGGASNTLTVSVV